ncbi:MAG: small basic protein [Planctomycetota bacterium]
MSVHKSLKIRNELARSRNVLTRAERLAAMKERNLWKEGDSVLGMPKLRITTRSAKKKKKEAPEEKKEEAPAEGEPEEKK